MTGRTWLVVLVSGVLGFGAATAAAGCGDDDRGEVTIQGGTTGTTPTSTTGTTPTTETAPATTETTPATTETTP